MTARKPLHNNDIIDINIAGLNKKRFRINGDDSKILELNTSDINIASRMSEAYPKLVECEKEISSISSGSDDTENELETEEIEDFSAKLKAVDKKMKDLIDFIFDSNVSEICAGAGSMYDPIGGYLRYEIIIDNLSSLYNDTLSKEMKNVQNRMKKHTAKYTKK